MITPKFDIGLIDRGMMLYPPSPRGWTINTPQNTRFGWDPTYIDKHGQEFSPWFFAKNCAAVLGYVRNNGCDERIREMAEYLHGAAAAHVEVFGPHHYVRNDFPFSFLWRYMQPPFYGAFMNNVTAFGYLQLYEATQSDRFLLLADRLLMTSVDRSAPVPLTSGVASDCWLLEYVFHLSPDDHAAAGRMGLRTINNWFVMRVFNGHIHALLALMRFRAMTALTFYDEAIEQAIDTMAKHLPHQLYKGRYFSYGPEPEIWPDYGQARACHLAEYLGMITGRDDIQSTASSMRKVFTSAIEPRQAEIVAEGMNDCLQAFGRPHKAPNAEPANS